MNYIPTTSECGLVIRKHSLIEKNIHIKDVNNIMKGIDILGENEKLISYGPLFGEEVVNEIKIRLSETKLEYVDDFFEINLLLPVWIKLGVAFA